MVATLERSPVSAAETALIAPIGAAYLIVCELAGDGRARARAAAVIALLLGGGPVTAIPLALFAFGARRVRYATVGLLQYVGPTLQLAARRVRCTAKPFPSRALLGFALIWLALVVYAGHGLWRARAERPKKPGAESAPGASI